MWEWLDQMWTPYLPHDSKALEKLYQAAGAPDIQVQQRLHQPNCHTSTLHQLLSKTEILDMIYQSVEGVKTMRGHSCEYCYVVFTR